MSYRNDINDCIEDGDAVYLSVITFGELRRGVEIIRHRGDADQAKKLERWLLKLSDAYSDSILSFDSDMAQV